MTSNAPRCSNMASYNFFIHPAIRSGLPVGQDEDKGGNPHNRHGIYSTSPIVSGPFCIICLNFEERYKATVQPFCRSMPVSALFLLRWLVHFFDATISLPNTPAFKPNITRKISDINGPDRCTTVGNLRSAAPRPRRPSSGLTTAASSLSTGMPTTSSTISPTPTSH